MRKFKTYATIAIVLVVLVIFVRSCTTFKTERVTSKVVTTQALPIIGKQTTEYRYLVVTDKETFIVESAWLHGKFNNSDIFWRIKTDSTYTFKVAGYGKTFVTDYRNILEVE